MTISRILVPTDFSPDADAALRYALDLARLCHASVHLVHVVDDPLAEGMWASEVYTLDYGELQRNLVRDAELRLAEAVPAAAGRVSSEVRLGKPWHQIVEAAAAHGADLIVMGTHGRSGVAHFVMGSVAERVQRRAPCPVLTLRAHVLTAHGGASQVQPATTAG